MIKELFDIAEFGERHSDNPVEFIENNPVIFDDVIVFQGFILLTMTDLDGREWCIDVDLSKAVQRLIDSMNTEHPEDALENLKLTRSKLADAIKRIDCAIAKK